MRYTKIPRQPLPRQNFMTAEVITAVRRFHATLPGYAPTPLVRLEALAKQLGLASLQVKDEAFRFGLNAFKVLGGSYAIACCLAQRLGLPLSALTYEGLQAARSQLQGLTFVTATDGNHGRGVAWTARELGCKAVVYLPQGSARERLENIRREGATATITDLNYDDAVRLAQRQAKEQGWIFVQDTSAPGYEDIPRTIMQGYGTMALEAFEAMDQPPTHIFLQAGVGSLAGAVTGLAADYWPEAKPKIIIVEPTEADCIYRTAEAADGRLHFVSGSMPTMMAGLACGEPCGLGWELLSAYADYSVACEDKVAALGMRVLGAPLPGDPRIISGESGAVTAGLVAELCLQQEKYAELRQELQLDAGSRVLCFSSEGDTDRENYRRVLWGL